MKRLEVLLAAALIGAILWPCLAQPTATNSVQTNTPTTESWNSISNRWSSLPLGSIKQAAGQGDVTAQYYLGVAYSDGNGVTEDQHEAFRWMKLAAQGGLAKAQRWLGWIYEHGAGVIQDYAEAAKFYRLAADQGHSMAQNNLGWLYKNGWGVPHSSADALKWFGKSAEQGEVLGQMNLGWMYAEGDLDKRDYGLAEKWLRKAAEQGSAEAQYQFGYLLTQEFNKSGQWVANFQVAAEWFRKAADQGYAKAQYELGMLYHAGKLGEDQRSKCIPWFLKAAAQGNAEAQAVVSGLPRFYPNNELLKDVDIIKAQRQSAESGNLNAQFELARRYQTGDGVPKDLAEAFKWMEKAAHNETPSSRVGHAIYALALMYEKGEGVSRDSSEARNLFLQAATAYRQSDAMFRVGQMYEKGDGMPQDDHKAVEFYANETHNYDSPDKYPNGFVTYGGAGDRGVEGLLNLWAQGRGFPTSQDEAEPGYRKPDGLIKYWEGLIRTAKAQFCAGEIYYQGKLVPKDIARAAEWFNKAATQGSPEAMNRIGEMWAAGMNGAPDQKEACNWYRKAATRGLAEAQYNLGLSYENGEGVSADPVEAWKWLQLAAEQKFPKASEARDKIQVTLTANQIKEARARADQISSAGRQ